MNIVDTLENKSPSNTLYVKKSAPMKFESGLYKNAWPWTLASPCCGCSTIDTEIELLSLSISLKFEKIIWGLSSSTLIETSDANGASLTSTIVILNESDTVSRLFKSSAVKITSIGPPIRFSYELNSRLLSFNSILIALLSYEIAYCKSSSSISLKTFDMSNSNGAKSSSRVISAIGFKTIGESLTGMTVITKLSEAENSESETDIETSTSPLKFSSKITDKRLPLMEYGIFSSNSAEYSRASWSMSFASITSKNISPSLIVLLLTSVMVGESLSGLIIIFTVASLE